MAGEQCLFTVGGLDFCMNVETARRSPKLGALLDSGIKFVDRDPELFPTVLNFMRGVSQRACLMSVAPGKLEALGEEAEYYQVDIFGAHRFILAGGTLLWTDSDWLAQNYREKAPLISQGVEPNRGARWVFISNHDRSCFTMGRKTSLEVVLGGIREAVEDGVQRLANAGESLEEGLNGIATAVEES